MNQDIGEIEEFVREIDLLSSAVKVDGQNFVFEESKGSEMNCGLNIDFHNSYELKQENEKIDNPIVNIDPFMGSQGSEIGQILSGNFNDANTERPVSSLLSLDEIWGQLDFSGTTERSNIDNEVAEDNASRSSQEEGNINSSVSDALIPNLSNELGMYGFKIVLDAKEDTLKTPTWLVSKITNKLYTNMNKPIPFRVILNKNYPKKRFSLRAMAVFKYPMSQSQNVVRCPNHFIPSDDTNKGFTHTNHVIRADHPRASYESTPSGRLSVVVPLDFPEGRNEAIPILLKFMCHNSCVGGIHRRRMVVLLTLELNDKEVGRFSIDVRVCACPSRDIKTEEKHHISRGLSKNAGHVLENSPNRKRPRNDESSGNEDEEEIFYLPVRGSTLYNYLRDSKLAYLKHHPDYARKYPDPPEYLDPHSRFAGTSQQDETHQELAESVDPTDDILSIESPQSGSLETPIENERSQYFFLLSSNSVSQNPLKIVSKFCKQFENLQPKGSKENDTVLVNKAMIKKEKFESECSEKEQTELDKCALTSSEAGNNQPKKKSKLVLERINSGVFRIKPCV